MSASIWNPGGTLVPQADPNSQVKSELFVATEGQTLFTLTAFTYVVNNGALQIYVNGVKQASSKVTETSTSSFTLPACEAGDVVEAVGQTAIADATGAAEIAQAAAAEALGYKNETEGFATTASASASEATGAANTATGAANAAADSAALAASYVPLNWRGAWLTATAYAVNDAVKEAGNSYICLVAHTSGTFATDLVAAKWDVIAEKGAAGSGSGDMIGANNLSDIADAATARNNLGLGTAAVADIEDFDTALQIHASDEKVTPVANDEFGLVDSAASNVLKRFKWSRLVTALNSLYATFTQGAKADTALQPSAIGTTVLGYVAPGDVGQSLTSNGTAWVSAAPTVSVGTTETTSGTAFDFTIPAGVREIITVFDAVSLSGTEDINIQLGDAGGIETTGYISRGASITTSPAVAITDSTTGFTIRVRVATNSFRGVATIINVSGNTWEFSYTGSLNSTNVGIGGGNKTLSDTLTQLRITRTGTDTFDNGSVTVFVRY